MLNKSLRQYVNEVIFIKMSKKTVNNKSMELNLEKKFKSSLKEKS